MCNDTSAELIRGIRLHFEALMSAYLKSGDLQKAQYVSCCCIEYLWYYWNNVNMYGDGDGGDGTGWVLVTHTLDARSNST